MSLKREHEDLEDGEVSDHDPGPPQETEQDSVPQAKQPQPKRLRTTASRQRHQHAGIDPTWGQKSVFSGFAGVKTTIPDGQEDEFEDDSDAMAYLMAVR